MREALALLDAAGFNRSNPLKFEIATAVGIAGDCAELLQAQWRQLSQDVVITEVKRLAAGAAYDETRSKRTFQYLTAGNNGPVNEIGATLTGMYRSDANRNFWGYKDPTLDAMLDKQQSILNREQRKAAVREINLYLIDRHPGVILTQRLVLNAAQPNVRNYHAEQWPYGRPYEAVWLDT